MITIFKNRLLLLIGFILSIGLFSSCDKDDVRSSAVELLSFGPTGVKHGDTLRFIGNNLNKVTEIVFTGKGASVPQKDFKQQTSELIQVIVPVAAERGVVTLKTPEGDVVSKSPLDLSVLISIASMSPLTARPGENITITGDYLNWVKAVTFFRNKTATTFVSQSKNELVVTIPEDAQTGTLVLSYSGTKSGDIETKDTLHVTLPAISSMSPQPKVKHGDNLTITGTNLDLVRQVIFNGDAPVSSFVSQSATQLVVKVPASTTKGKLTLKVASGLTVQSSTDVDVVLPNVTAMDPILVDPGANLTITGTDLDLVKGISFVGVNNEVTTFVSQSATQLVVAVPTAAITGRLTLSMKNSTLTVKSPTLLRIVGSPLPPIIIYDDALNAELGFWTGGGWGGTKDVANTTPVKAGTKSVKINYDAGGWGVPWQLGGGKVDLAGYKLLKFSVYGGAGSEGKSVNVGFNEKDGKTITIKEGEWTDFAIPLTDISSATNLAYLYFKNYSATGAFTIYLDNIGIYEK